MTAMISSEKKNRLRKILLAVVAAAAVVVGFVFTFSNKETGHLPVETPQSGIMLTLGDGATILLDTLSSAIGQQGALISKAGEASLTYDETVADGDVLVYNEISVTRGRSVDIFLSDGTHVWLNADSRLRFPVRFPGTERRVELEGEAYFDVSSDAERRFIVENLGQSVTVLGTEFNIYGYRDEPIYTTLLTGSIEIMKDDRQILLTPGQQCITHADGSTEVKQVSVENYASWKEGFLILENKPLEDILKGVERIYDIRFAYDGESLDTETLKGRIPTDYTLEQTLSIISHSTGAEFSAEGSYIRVRP